MTERSEKNLNIHIGNWLSHHYNWRDKNNKLKRQNYFKKITRADMAKDYFNSLDDELKSVCLSLFENYETMIVYIAKTIDWLLPKRLFYKLRLEKGINGKPPTFFSINQVPGMKYEFQENADKDRLKQDYILCQKLKSEIESETENEKIDT